MKPFAYVRLRHSRLTWFLFLLLFAMGLQAQAEKPAQIDRVAQVSMVVSNMDRSIDFYSNVLTFEKVSDVEPSGADIEHLEGLFGVRMRVVRMRLGDEFLELTEFLTPHGRPIPADSRSNDRWFQHIAIITNDMDRAYKRLREHKLRYASTAPQLLPAYLTNAAGIRAFYFRDPDNHFLEILQFPPDKGDPKWHQPADRLFLGVDHTAIVVDDTDASLRFYRDTLGMHIAGESENYGTEQEHLNNIFGAHLRITSLRSAVGPGIELLEYLTPRDGRAMPADSHTDDLWSWQTTLVARDAAATAHAIRDGRFSSLSTNPILLSTPDLGFTEAFVVRDPDGHLIRVAEQSAAVASSERVKKSRR
jgi:catechol 2,3-dioxygenase-like lactoylglutathione lyase family enzyme